MISLPVFECDGCGACCQSIPIFVSLADAQREPRIAAEAQRLAENLADARWTYRLYPLPFLPSCPFLGEDCRCTIYASRPQVCREFNAGDWHCQEARRRRGLSPLESVSRKGLTHGESF
jgi:Fe-S-cluster containining protein